MTKKSSGKAAPKPAEQQPAKRKRGRPRKDSGTPAKENKPALLDSDFISPVRMTASVRENVRPRVYAPTAKADFQASGRNQTVPKLERCGIEADAVFHQPIRASAQELGVGNPMTVEGPKPVLPEEWTNRGNKPTHAPTPEVQKGTGEQNMHVDAEPFSEKDAPALRAQFQRLAVSPHPRYQAPTREDMTEAQRAVLDWQHG